MASTMRFELVSPERILLSGDSVEVLLPGSEGDMTILPGHAPVLTLLRPGTIEVTLDGTKSKVFLSRGFAEVLPERVTVLAEKAFAFSELSAELVSSELAAAERAHAEAGNDHEKFMTSEAVNALTKLKTAHW